MNLWSKIKLLSGRYVEEHGDIVERKYRFTKGKYYANIPELDIGAEVYQIKATRTLTLENGDVVKKGTLGGWVTSPESLSHRGNCWIDEESKIIDSYVSQDAYIENSIVFENSRVAGKSFVKNSHIGWESRIRELVTIKTTEIQGATISGNVSIQLSKLCDVTIQGDAELFDVTLENVKIKYKKGRRTTQALPLSMKRVQLMCKAFTFINEITSHCQWEDVKLSPSSLKINAPSRMKKVKSGDNVIFSFKSETNFQHVEFESDTQLFTDGKLKPIWGESALHPVTMAGDFNFLGFTVIKGGVHLSGTWTLSNVRMEGNVELKSDTEMMVFLTESQLDSMSSIFVKHNARFEEPISIEDLSLTNDDRYVINSKTYVN